jgi:hypothetical protein
VTRRFATRLAGTVLLCNVLACLAPAVRAEQTTVTAPAGAPNNAVTTSSRLDFTINIGKFLFFGVGTGTFPASSATVDSVAFSGNFSIPPTPTAAVTGNNTPVNWSGAAPSLGVAGAVTLPVEVRSNAGQVTVRATVNTPLANGPQVIPFSQILINSSDANLPAPLIPNSGTGASVNVAGTSFTNLVTQRTANWTFSYTPAASLPAGVYSGLLTFTASAP